jgi:RNA-directed DNA polymerase
VNNFARKRVAVKTVTSNKGKNTPGIDNVTWNTPEAKY